MKEAEEESKYSTNVTFKYISLCTMVDEDEKSNWPTLFSCGLMNNVALNGVPCRAREDTDVS